MRNLSLRIKCRFSKINFAFCCRALFYSKFILLKIALKNFKKMQMVHLFDEFFCFSNLFFKPLFLSQCKNLRAQKLYRVRDCIEKGQQSGPPTPPPRKKNARLQRALIDYGRRISLLAKHVFHVVLHSGIEIHR